MKLGEFFVKLGVDTEIGKLIDFNTKMKDITLGSAATIAGIIGVSTEFKNLFENALETAMGLQMFDSQTGLSTEQLQKWQIAAERANVSADSISGAIQSLQKNITEIRLGRGNIAPFQLLGLDINEDPFTLLNSIRSRIAGMPKPLAVNLISQLGFNPEMIQILSLTNKQLKEMAGPDLILSEKNQRKLLLMRLEIVKLRQEFMAWSRNIMADLSPAFRIFGNILSDFMQMTKSFTTVIEESEPARAAFLSFLTLAAIKTAPLTALLTALLLVMEDIFIYKKGGISMWGEAFGEKENKNIPGWGEKNWFEKWAYKFQQGWKGGESNVTQNNNITQNIYGPSTEKIVSMSSEELRKTLSQAADQLNNTEKK